MPIKSSHLFNKPIKILKFVKKNIFLTYAAGPVHVYFNTCHVIIYLFRNSVENIYAQTK